MAGRWLFAFPRVALADSLYPWRHDSVDRSGLSGMWLQHSWVWVSLAGSIYLWQHDSVDRSGLQVRRVGRELLLALSGVVAGMWQYDAFAPIGYGLSDLQLFSGVHVIGVLDHDGIHATGAAGLTLNR